MGDYTYWREPKTNEDKEKLIKKVIEKIDLKKEAYYYIDISIAPSITDEQGEEDDDEDAFSCEDVCFFSSRTSLLDVCIELKRLSKISAGYLTLYKMEPEEKHLKCVFGYVGVVSCKDGKTIERYVLHNSMDFDSLKDKFIDFLKTLSYQEISDKFGIE